MFSQGGTVHIATGYGMDVLGVEVRATVRSITFIFTYHPDRSGLHPPYYLMGTVGSFAGGKAAKA
jgi:hypothetical protein